MEWLQFTPEDSLEGTVKEQERKVEMNMIGKTLHRRLHRRLHRASAPRQRGSSKGAGDWMEGWKQEI